MLDYLVTLDFKAHGDAQRVMSRLEKLSSPLVHFIDERTLRVTAPSFDAAATMVQSRRRIACEQALVDPECFHYRIREIPQDDGTRGLWDG
jgi:hypothetical protein